MVDIIKKIITVEYLIPDETLTVQHHEYEMDIKLTDNTPLHTSPRRLSYYEKIDDGLLSRKVIQPSRSPYVSAVVLVKKKSGEIRMCVDYRALNKVTARDNFSLPLIEECLGYVGGKKYFSTLDLKDGFFHVAVASNQSNIHRLLSHMHNVNTLICRLV